MLTFVLSDVRGSFTFQCTLVATQDAEQPNPALEIWHGERWWPVRVTAGRDALVVNAGDYLSLVSRGVSRSPRHRVVSPSPPHHRFSLVFFYYPNFNSTIPLTTEYDADLSLLECQMATELQGSCANLRLSNMRNGKARGQSHISFGEYIAEKWREVARPSTGSSR